MKNFVYDGKIKKLIFLILLLSSAVMVFSQTVLESDVFPQIDGAFMEKNPAKVSAILTKYKGTSYYKRCEEYVLHNIRLLILSNQIDLIQSMSMAVIDVNLDCQDAVNLYMTVEKSIAKRNARLAEEQKRKEQEAAYVAAAPEKTREEIRRDYTVVANKSTGETVFMNPVDTEYYNDFGWHAAINMLDLGVYLKPDAEGAMNTNLKYGIAVDGRFYYRGDDVFIGLDGFADFLVVDTAGADAVSYGVLFVPEISFKNLNRKMFFRCGFSNESTEGDGFFSPVVGLAFRDISIGSLEFNMYADYLPGHLFYNNINAAMGAGLEFVKPVAKFTSAQVLIKLGVREYLTLETSGVTSRSRVSLGIGVENHD